MRLFLAGLLLLASTAASAQTARAPDLTVEITGFTLGQKGSVEALVTNNGRVAAGPSRIDLVIDPAPHGVHFKVLGQIEPGEQVPVRIIGTIAPGVTLTVTVDSKAQVREFDERNNVAVLDVPLEEVPPPQPAEPTAPPTEPDAPSIDLAAPPEGASDLVVELIDVSGGDSGTVRARVSNRGEGASVATRLRLERKGQRHAYAGIPPLDPGTDTDVELEAVFAEGEAFTLIVDPDDRVVESDETNNRVEDEAPAPVAPEPPPQPHDKPLPPDVDCACDLKVSAADLVVAIEQIESGPPVLVRALLRNIGTEPSGSADVTLTVTSGKVTQYVAAVPALDPGQTHAVTFEVVLARPSFEAFVDSGFAVLERDEENNRSGLISSVIEQPITSGPPIATVGRFPIAIAPALVAGRGEIGGHRRGDPPRPIAALRFPNGSEITFVEDELIIETDQATAVAIAERYNGQIVSSFDRREKGRQPSFAIRIDPTMAKLDPPEQATSKDNVLVSSQRALGLIAIIAAEQREGRHASIDPLNFPDSAFDQTLPEGGDYDALKLSYVETGGELDVNLVGAWQLLELANATENTVAMAIIDHGFIDNGDLPPATGDIGFSVDSGDEGHEYHGTNVAEAAAAIHGNDIGSVGPAGPAVRLDLHFSFPSTFDKNVALREAVAAGARIVNMSWGHYEPADFGLFSDKYPSSVTSFEDDTELFEASGLLLFASAGNDGRDVDHTDIDGDEDDWKFPCENVGVICVGGWTGDLPVRDQESNYGRGLGETVDIDGPFTVLIGPDPSVVDSDPASFAEGTSLSSPFVAGIAALVWQANPALTNHDVWALLDKYAKPGDKVRVVNAFGPVREALMGLGKSFAPSVKLDSPVAPIVASQTAPLKLSAHGIDVEDGMDCCTITWSTDKDGPLGTGKEITVDFSDKTPGLRVLKLTATDSSGKSGTRFYVIDFPNKPASLDVLSPKPGDLLAPGIAYDFRAQLIDETTLVAIPMTDCTGLKWWSLYPKDPDPLAEGCDVSVSFATPGKRTVIASYTDKYGAVSTEYVPIDVKEPTGNQIHVTLSQIGDGYAFASFERIPLGFVISDPGAKPETSYLLDWRLGRTQAEMRAFVPLEDGGQKYISIDDVFPERSFSIDPADYLIELTIKDKSRPFAGGSTTRSISLLPAIH